MSRFARALVAFLGGTGGLAIPAAAQVRDLRTQTDAFGATEVSFCAGPSPDTFGLPGHAFVAFSDERHGQPRRFRAIGHTIGPQTGSAAAAFTYFNGATVAGRQAEERYTALKQACLTAKVDRVVFDRAVAAARPTLTALGIDAATAATLERYSLNGQDCMDFLMRVARQLAPAGLTVPPRAATDLPAGYVGKLIAANRPR